MLIIFQYGLVCLQGKLHFSRMLSLVYCKSILFGRKVVEGSCKLIFSVLTLRECSNCILIVLISTSTKIF